MLRTKPIRGTALIILLLAFSLWGSDFMKLYDDSRVAEIRISMDPAALEWMYQNVESDSMHVASVRFTNNQIDETIDSVGVRLRGNTSRNAAKKSFKLSFNTFVSGRQFFGVDKLNLNGEHNDPSVIRSKICWDLFHDIGLEASGAAHAAVTINDVYYGLYISVEHIDDEFLQNHFDDPSGNLWKCLWPADLTYRGSDPTDYHPYYSDVRPYELKTNRDAYDYTQLVRLIDIINNTPDEALADSLEQILAVPEVMKYLAVNVLTGSWDDYWYLMNNYYLYFEPEAGLFHWIPYDYDNTLGIDWFGIDWSTTYPYNFGYLDASQNRPLVERILGNPAYRNLYSHFLDFYKDHVYDLSVWESRLDSLKEMITPWAEVDTFRTLDYGFTLEDFHQSYTAGSYVNQHVHRGIREFVNRRITSLAGLISWVSSEPVIYALDWTPETPGSEDSIRVTISVFSQSEMDEVSIVYQPEDLRISETYPMSPQPVSETKRVEEADRWIGTIPPLGDSGFGFFQVSAENSTGTATFPRTTAIPVQASGTSTNPIVINEFLAGNTSVNTDDAGEADDWLELYNPTTSDLFLSGYYLTDDSNDLTKWQFSFGGVGIAAGDFLLVWCDNDPQQQGLHASFRLNRDGEFIALVEPDGSTIIDSVSFGSQSEDISFGRYPDGGNTWSLFQTPTPDAANTMTSRDNEITVPDDFTLHQNHPNPFNGFTRLRYDLARKGRVRLVIFDIRGRPVRRLFSGEKEAGSHTAEWDGCDDAGRPVSSGMYLCRIEIKTPDASSPVFTGAKKMVLMK